ncbi:MAG: T9SS type A sorting domain-containing protein [Candidatus Kapaibacterium sp.]
MRISRSPGLFVLLLSVTLDITGIARAQPDTIPQLLQPVPFWMQDSYAAQRGADTVFITHANGIGISIDGGRTFELRDTAMGGCHGICLTRIGPLWQFNSSGALERSETGGLTWEAPPSPQSAAASVVDGVSSDGRRFWFQTRDRKKIVSTTDDGVSWDTLLFASAPYVPQFDWLDAEHGVQLIPDTALRTTSNGGQTWDSVVTTQSPKPQVQILTQSSGQGTGLFYIASGVIESSIGPGAAFFLSSDTGHSWSFHANVDQIGIVVTVRDSLWYAIGNGGLFRSTDRSATWNPAHSTCPNGPGALAFGDALHGTALGTAITSDGGYSWDCLDTTIYVPGVRPGNIQNIFTSEFDASSYYGFATRYGETYLCLTTDRGNAWSMLFPVPAGTSFLPLRHRLLFGSPADVIWTDDYGKTFDTLNFNYQGVSGFLKRAPDGALWAGNEREFLVSLDSGSTWTDRFDSVPYRWDSTQLNYTFTPVDRTTGFGETSNGGIFRTTDAGLTWRSDSSHVPTFVLDARHWFYSPRYRTDNYTTDAGATWDSITEPPTTGYAGALFAVDPERWMLNGFYTMNAGHSWQPIPGWTNAEHVLFTVSDSSTAFGGNAPYKSLWRLDMPWYVKPVQLVETAPAQISPPATAAPNPAGETTMLSFTTTSAGNVTIELFDILGKKVSNGFSGTLAVGNHTQPVSLAGLPAGIYYARIAISSGIQTIKLVKE